MASEETRAAIGLLMDEVARHPEDRGIVHRKLCDLLADLRAQGEPVPHDLARLERQLACDDTAEDAVDLFDNMPV